MNKVVLRKKVVTPTSSALDVVRNEIAVLDALPRHPNVARLIEVIDDPASDKLYICLEHAGAALSPRAPLRDDDALLGVLAQSLRGLAFLHARGVVHGDLKAEHLLLSPTEEDPDNAAAFAVKIVDFGSSATFDAAIGDSLTKSPGTPAYTAPECCTGEAYSGTKADVWALGITAFALRYGRFPFASESAVDVYDEIQSRPNVAVPPDGAGGGGNSQSEASETLSRAMRAMLAPRPEERVSAAEALGILETAGRARAGGDMSTKSVAEIEREWVNG